MAIKVVKLGGNEIDSPEFLREFAQIVAADAQPTIIVHGGGKEIALLQTRLGIKPRFIEGLRVTDEESLQIVEMVLGGAVNKRLVRTLNAAGARVSFAEITTDKGHDAFLLDEPELLAIVRGFLEGAAKARGLPPAGG